MSDSDSDEYDPLASKAVAIATHHSKGIAPHGSQQLLFPKSLQQPTAVAHNAPKITTHNCSEPASGPFPVVAKLRTSSREDLVSCCVSPDCSTLFVGDKAGTLMIYNFLTPPVSEGANRPVQPTHRLEPFPNRSEEFLPVLRMECGMGGSFLVATHEGDRAVLLDMSGKELGRTIAGLRSITDSTKCSGHKAAITDVSTSQAENNKFCTSSIDGTGRLWDVRGVQRSSIFAVKHGSSNALAESNQAFCCTLPTLSGGGKLLGTGGADGVIQLWDTSSPFRHGKSAFALAASSSVGAIAETAENVILGRFKDGGLRFFDLRKADGPLEVEPCVPGLFYIGDTATMHVVKRSDGCGNTVVAATSNRGFGKRPGSHLVEIVAGGTQRGETLRYQPVGAKEIINGMTVAAQSPSMFTVVSSEGSSEVWGVSLRIAGEGVHGAEHPFQSWMSQKLTKRPREVDQDDGVSLW